MEFCCLFDCTGHGCNMEGWQSLPPWRPMKLKCQPEDFRVEELPLTSPAGGGRYTFYRLTKRNIGTIEAVEAICRRWNLAGRRVSYGGLKDRHAVTIQYLTIADGPAKPMTPRTSSSNRWDDWHTLMGRNTSAAIVSSSSSAT